MREYLTIKTKGETTKQHASRGSGQTYEGTDKRLTRDLHLSVESGSKSGLVTHAYSCDTRERCQRITWGQRDVLDQLGKQQKSLAQIKLKQITATDKLWTTDGLNTSHTKGSESTMEKAEEQKGESGLGLIETVVGGKYPHCNTWSLPGGAVCGGLGSAASLERVHHWGWVLR